MKRVALILLAVVLPVFAAAAPLEHDLGLRLVYVRVHQLPADLPAKPAGRVPPCIVDVRYVETHADGAAAFVLWVKSRATLRTPVFVLANAATSAELLKPFSVREKETGIVLVGIEGERFRPDVAVRASADDERRAYDALEKGAEIGTLLADSPNKVRHDEASLSKDRPAELPPGVATTGDGRTVSLSLEEPSPVKPVALPIDATLQRAVHLHRALVALKKI